MLSNFELERLAKFYKLPLISICMKNELPNTVKNGCYIINMQSSTQGNGTHWVALFVYQNNGYYFDSFGATPPIEITKFVKKRKGCHLLYNNFIIQDLKSENCGWYCLAFLIYMYGKLQSDLKQVYNEFVNNFLDDTTENDKILQSYFSSLSGNMRPYVLRKFIKS